jgi:hypothetical protein
MFSFRDEGEVAGLLLDGLHGPCLASLPRKILSLTRVKIYPLFRDIFPQPSPTADNHCSNRCQKQKQDGRRQFQWQKNASEGDRTPDLQISFL